MSMNALNWAYGLKNDPNLSGPRKAVLATLAYHANRAGECWPKCSTLASECGLNKSTVGKALAWLDGNGYLERDRQHDKGHLQNYRFTLALERPDHSRDAASLEQSEGIPRTVSPSTATPFTRTNCKEEPTTEATASTVNGSSYVADKYLSTSTTDGAGAVEEEPFDNHASQEENPEHDLRSLVAKLETSRPGDGTELNGSGKEGGAQTAPELPAEVQDVLAKFRGLDRIEVVAKWRRHLNEDVSHEATLALRRYCELRVGNDWTDPLKPHQAAARALPEAEGRFTRPVEAVA